MLQQANGKMEQSMVKEATPPPSDTDEAASSGRDTPNLQKQNGGTAVNGVSQGPNDQNGNAAKVIALSEKLERANRVLAAAKRSIDGLKSRLEEKDKLIEANKIKHERLFEIVKSAREENEELKAIVNANARDSDDNGQDGEEALPVCALKCVEAEGVKWYLVQNAAAVNEWLMELEMYKRIGDDEVNFELPKCCISEEESETIRNKLISLQKELQQTSENFRRFRVRSEIVRKQKEAELVRMSDNNLKYKQHNIVGQDVQEELKLAQLRVEKLAQVQASLELDKERLQEQLKQSHIRVRTLESELRSSSRSQVSTSFYDDSKPTDTDSLDNASKLTEQLAKLKREYDNYRSRMMEILQKKDDELNKIKAHLENVNSISSSTPAAKSSKSKLSTPQSAPPAQAERQGEGGLSMSKILVSKQKAVDVAYLKNIVMKYMAADAEPETREHMEAAIATVLGFTKSDVSFIQKKRLAASPNLLKSSTWKFF